MTRDVLTPESPDLTAEACAWIAQLETGAFSQEDLAAFREWIERSPRHYVEARRVAYLSRDINVIANMADPLREAASRRRALTRRPRAAVRFSRRVVLEALALAVAAGAGFLVRGLGEPPAPYLIATGIGEYEESELPDRSKISLNTDSQVEISFGKAQRRVRLLKGEAYFEVARDPARPFVVYAGDKRVMAVGTAFAVRWTDNDLVVTVSEGRVAFDDASESGAARPGAAELSSPFAGAPSSVSSAPYAVLEAGQRLSLLASAANKIVEPVSARELTRELSWRSGLLEFEKAPLEDVVHEMERYTSLDIEIVDEELKGLNFGGIFRIGETDAFFEALELSFGVKVVRIGENRVLLERGG